MRNPMGPRAGMDGLNRGPGDDPDADQCDHLFEYAVGGFPLPGSNSISEMPRYRFAEEGGAAVFHYIYDRRRNAERLGLLYQVLACSDLRSGEWEPVSGAESVFLINEQFESVTNRVLVDSPSNPLFKLYIELESQSVRK